MVTSSVNRDATHSCFCFAGNIVGSVSLIFKCRWFSLHNVESGLADNTHLLYVQKVKKNLIKVYCYKTLLCINVLKVIHIGNQRIVLHILFTRKIISCLFYSCFQIFQDILKQYIFRCFIRFYCKYTSC